MRTGNTHTDTLNINIICLNLLICSVVVLLWVVEYTHDINTCAERYILIFIHRLLYGQHFKYFNWRHKFLLNGHKTQEMHIKCWFRFGRVIFSFHQKVKRIL